MNGTRIAALIVIGLFLGVLCSSYAVALLSDGVVRLAPAKGTARSADAVSPRTQGRVFNAGFADPKNPVDTDEEWDKMSDIHTVDGNPGGRLQFEPETGRVRVCDIEEDGHDAVAMVSLGKKVVEVRANGKGRCDEAKIPDVGKYLKSKPGETMKYGFIVCLVSDKGPEYCNTATLAGWPDGDKSDAACETLAGQAQALCYKAIANPESRCSKIHGPAKEHCQFAAATKCDVPEKAKRYCKAYENANLPGGRGAPGGLASPGEVPGPPGKAPSASFDDRPDETLKLRGHADGASALATQAGTFLGWLRWFALGGCLAGFMLVGANMAIKHRRSEAGDHAAGLSWVLLATVIAGAGVATGFISLLFEP